jgi:hypothetical protein
MGFYFNIIFSGWKYLSFRNFQMLKNKQNNSGKFEKVEYTCLAGGANFSSLPIN